MKKVINESTIKSIIRETLINYLKESKSFNLPKSDVMENEEMLPEEDMEGNEIMEDMITTSFNDAFKKAMNEISDDLAARASAAAYQKNRSKQGGLFNRYALDTANSGTKNNEGIIAYSTKEISYKNAYNNVVRIFSDGQVEVAGSVINLKDDFKPNEGLKTSDKVVARKIAKWWNTYANVSENSKSIGSDWHIWAKL
jgi:5'-3' exonuclease